jgi:hypothetical protein
MRAFKIGNDSSGMWSALMNTPPGRSTDRISPKRTVSRSGWNQCNAVAVSTAS